MKTILMIPIKCQIPYHGSWSMVDSATLRPRRRSSKETILS